MRKEDGARYFGPFVHSQALYATQEWLNRHFRLRTCKVKNPGLNDFKHCHADVIRNCSAPCVGRISVENYNRNFDQAVRLLEGVGKKNALDALTEEMMQAADSLDFERAAYLRDIRDNLIKTLEPARRFQKGTPNLPGTVHPEEDMKELGEALGLDEPPSIMECFDISNVSSNHIVASMVRFTNGKPDNKAYRRYRIRTVDGQNDFASMSEVIRRRYSRILMESDAVASRPPDMTLYQWLKKLSAEGKAPIKVPDLVVVDGGKGQLSSALADLEAIGLGDMPIVGLAKQREEIFFPHQPEPLRLPHSTGALKLMQRIRDEAHRFANGYNELLYRKRMKESALDDAPGMSAAKKRLLLEKFKSVAAIKKADPGLHRHHSRHFGNLGPYAAGLSQHSIQILTPHAISHIGRRKACPELCPGRRGTLPQPSQAVRQSGTETRQGRQLQRRFRTVADSQRRLFAHRHGREGRALDHGQIGYTGAELANALRAPHRFSHRGIGRPHGRTALPVQPCPGPEQIYLAA